MAEDKKPEDEQDVNEMLAERERLEQKFQEKFMKVITVMFTDIKGSTAIADTKGTMFHRTLIKHHNDIVFPIIQKYGQLVKTMGDGTMSYFTNAQDAVRCGAAIQREIDQFNIKKSFEIPILVRVGMHTGKGIVEKSDIFGDVVNVASRFESSASPGEVYLSEETYNALANKAEIYCRFLKTTTLKGKKEPFKIYKAFWDPKEAERDLAGKHDAQAVEKKEGMSMLAKILFILVPALIVIFIALEEMGVFSSGPDVRTKRHSISDTEPAK